MAENVDRASPPSFYLANSKVSKSGSIDGIWVYQRGSPEIVFRSLKDVWAPSIELDQPKVTSLNRLLQKLTTLEDLSLADRSDFSQFLSTQWLQVRLSRSLSSNVAAEDDLDRDHRATVYIKALTEMIFRMRWSLRTTDQDEHLVTSDCPVILNNPSTVKEASQHTPLAYEVIFPVCPRVLLIATWDGHAGYGPMSPRIVHQINKLVSFTAEKYVYSSVKIPAISRYLFAPRKELIHPDFSKLPYPK
jgi:hypothetical protein